MNSFRRPLLHLIFWLTYWLVYAYTYSRYDGQFGKYLLTEGLQMPARVLATYAAFWWVNRLAGQPRLTWLALAGVAVVDIAGGLLNRLLKYCYIVPTYFPDATITFWDWRAMIDIFDCVLATGVALTGLLFFRQQESLRREAGLQREKSEAELQALKSQLHPHFLFNTINSLYALALIRSEKTAPVALQLAHLLRFVLYETRKPDIPLEQEVRILQDYLALEKLRFDDDRLRVTTRFDLDNPAQPITPLLLLPLLENAFKHGVSEHRTEAWVRLEVVLRAGKLRVEIKNSLPPHVPDEREKNGESKSAEAGIGLPSVRRQLELVYPGKSSLAATTMQGLEENTSPYFLTVLTIGFY